MMKLSTLSAAMLILPITMGVHAYAATPDAEAVYKAAQNQADAEYKVSRKKCDMLNDNPKEICIAEASATRVRTDENAKAAMHNTMSARTHASKKIADADYDVDKAKCGAQTGNNKDICVKKAKSTQTATIATATADQKIAEARSDEASDKNTAEYKVALEKCDSVTGAAKDNCIAAAKLKFAK